MSDHGQRRFACTFAVAQPSVPRSRRRALSVTSMTFVVRYAVLSPPLLIGVWAGPASPPTRPVGARPAGGGGCRCRPPSRAAGTAPFAPFICLPACSLRPRPLPAPVCCPSPRQQLPHPEMRGENGRSAGPGAVVSRAHGGAAGGTIWAEATALDWRVCWLYPFRLRCHRSCFDGITALFAGSAGSAFLGTVRFVILLFKLFLCYNEC